MAEPQPSKLVMRVRSPSPAPPFALVRPLTTAGRQFGTISVIPRDAEAGRRWRQLNVLRKGLSESGIAHVVLAACAGCQPSRSWRPVAQPQPYERTSVSALHCGLTELSSEIGLLSLRRLVPVMSALSGQLNLLTAETSLPQPCSKRRSRLPPSRRCSRGPPNRRAPRCLSSPCRGSAGVYGRRSVRPGPGSRARCRWRCRDEAPRRGARCHLGLPRVSFGRWHSLTNMGDRVRLRMQASSRRFSDSSTTNVQHSSGSAVIWTRGAWGSPSPPRRCHLAG